jgi:hypothetical protein
MLKASFIDISSDVPPHISLFQTISGAQAQSPGLVYTSFSVPGGPITHQQGHRL